jgi:FkbH-like protein
METNDSMPWLLPAPADFRARLKALQTPSEADLRTLSSYALDVGQLGRLSKLVASQYETLRTGTGLSALRLGLVSSHTTDYMLDALPATALRHGILLSCVTTPYGQVAQSVMASSSPLAGQVDVVLFALDPYMLGLATPRLNADEGAKAVDSAISMMKSLSDGARHVIGAACALTTLPPPADSLFGDLDGRTPGTSRWMIELYNQRLAAEVLGPGDLLIDVAALASSVGLANWHDARVWHSGKLPFALEFTPIYADHVGRALGAFRGKSRKCLVLDLDNTLWGGVIGDDGLDGIKIGQGSAAGEAHAAIQSYALSLRERGIVLAVCSKNEEANARLPFKEHPEMLLKEEHFAVFVANWSDKAGNLRNIAATLNIGIDALVFLDDNPAERAIVRQTLPEVAVPEVGDDPATYVGAVARAGWFEATAFSDDDRKRAEYYSANSARLTAQQSITNMEDYLKSLDMVAAIGPFDEVSRARISQLINKSNQFNLTTRRYNEAEVAAFQADPQKFTVQARLADRFGDNGMISVIIFDIGPEVWSCDTWLMSCRVLGRRMEEAVLAYVAKAAAAAGASRLRGTYLPTKKNGLVEKHFEKLGFTLVQSLEGGGTVWELDLATYVAPDLPIRVEPIQNLSGESASKSRDAVLESLS